MSSDIEICSNAFIRIGAPPISSFTEGGAQGIAASNLYEIEVRRLLTTYMWRFTMAKRQLARLTAVPLNEWQYAFQLPSDFLQLAYPYPNTDFQIYEDKIYANTDTLEIDYQFRPPEVQFPSYFQAALELRLASEFALSVTSNRSLSETYELKAQDQLKIARFTDAQQSPATSVQSFDYVTARG